MFLCSGKKPQNSCPPFFSPVNPPAFSETVKMNSNPTDMVWPWQPYLCSKLHLLHSTKSIKSWLWIAQSSSILKHFLTTGENMFSVSSSQSTGDGVLKGKKPIRALTTKSVHCLSVFSGDLGTPCLLRRTKNLSLQYRERNRQTHKDRQWQRQSQNFKKSPWARVELDSLKSASVWERRMCQSLHV